MTWRRCAWRSGSRRRQRRRRRMDQHRFASLEAAHDDDELPGGEIVDRNRGAFLGGHAFGPREDPPVGAHTTSAYRQIASARTHCVQSRWDRRLRPPRRRARRLRIPERREFGQIRIEAHPAHHVSEIDPACLNANARLARSRIGIGASLDERLGRPGLRNPNLQRWRSSARLDGKASLGPREALASAQDAPHAAQSFAGASIPFS